MTPIQPECLEKSSRHYKGTAKPWKNDGYMAAYLGFAERSDYLKLLLSQPVLDLALSCEKYLLSKNWLEVANAKLREPKDRDFNSYSEISTAHPLEDVDRERRVANQDHGLAKMLCHGYECIQAYFALPVAARKTRIPWGKTQWKKATKLSVPQFDVESQRPPAMGPLGGEDLLERFNRVYYLVKAL